MSRSRVFLLLALVAGVVLFFALGLQRYLSLEYLKSAQGEFAALYAERPLAVIGSYFLIYVAVAALSLPGAAIMTLAGGAIFGLWVGTLVVSFASSIGATLAMLAARYVLRDSIKARFAKRVAEIDRGVERDGAFYLFTLRLVPALPFFVVNLVMGLTAMKARSFYLVSQVGMLAGTLVYVNAGTQLAQISSLKGILSPGLVGSFVLLGLFPLLAKKIVDLVQARKVYAPWAERRPRVYDRNLVVIGAGAAGLVTSYIAAVVKAKVTLIEGHKMGGDCLNYGCVPSKALIKTATLVRQMRHSADYGVAKAEWQLDFAQVMARVARVIDEIAPHDSVERYTGLGVDVVEGRATIVDPWHVKIVRANGGEQTLSTRAIVIATGAEPFVPPLPGLQEAGFLTSDTLWGLRDLAAAAAGAGRRADRLRAGPGLRAPGFAGDAGGDGTAPDGPRGRGGLGLCAPGPGGRRRARAHRPQGPALRDRRRRQMAGGGSGGRRTAPALRRAAVRGRPRRAAEGVRARGTRHPGAAHGAGRTPGCRRSTPTSWPPATLPGPTSSRTLRRTRPGTRR